MPVARTGVSTSYQGRESILKSRLAAPGAGTCSNNGGTNGWLCQHRWSAIAGMVGFRNTVMSTSSNALTNWVSPSSQQIAFARGQVAFVAINNQDSAWAATFQSGLPAGTYCNVISGVPNGSVCAAGSYVIFLICAIRVLLSVFTLE